MFRRRNSIVSRQHTKAEKLFGKGQTAFMRFLPEADDLDDVIKDVKDDLGEGKKKEDQEKFDKERQRADQEAANAKKSRDEAAQAKAENATVRTELSTLETERQRLEGELVEARAKLSGNQMPAIDVAEMDGNEKVLAQSIQVLQKQISDNAEAAKQERDAHQAKITQYETAEAQKVQQARSDASYNELLSSLDSDYGAECRNEAVAAYQEKWANGDVPKDNAAAATRILEKCYAAATKKQKSTGDKKGFSSDTGSGGGRPGAGISTLNTKQGDRSLTEVVAEAKGAMT